MISDFKIENIDKDNYTYTLEYQNKNEFKLTLYPNVSFTEKHLLTIFFAISRSILPDESFYLKVDYVKV